MTRIRLRSAQEISLIFKHTRYRQSTRHAPGMMRTYVFTHSEHAAEHMCYTDSMGNKKNPRSMNKQHT
jgi:hypothetical protein